MLLKYVSGFSFKAGQADRELQFELLRLRVFYIIYIFIVILFKYLKVITLNDDKASSIWCTGFEYWGLILGVTIFIFHFHWGLSKRSCICVLFI